MKTRKALIIDPDPPFRWYTAFRLENELGVKSEFALTVTEGLQRASETKYDLVLTDLFPGPPSGLDLGVVLKNSDSDTVIAILFTTLQGCPLSAFDIERLGIDLVVKREDFETILLPRLKNRFFQRRG